MPKQQTRIVLAESVTPLAEQIKETTGASSLSEVLTLLLTRYGPHLIEWWQTNPHLMERTPVSNIESAPIIPNIDLSTPIEI